MADTSSTSLRQFFSYNDSKYYFAKALEKYMKRKEKQIERSLTLQTRILEILFCLCSELSNESKTKLLFQIRLKRGDNKRIISRVWLIFLQIKLKKPTRIKVLSEFSGKIIPHVSQPRLLTDFLINNFNSKTEIGILSVFGLFKIMTDFNVECSGFYNTLYCHLGSLDFNSQIWEPELKHKFWSLLHTVLQSSHLPSTVVMAFIKRIARKMLFQPIPDLIICLNIVGKLLASHPSSRVLLSSNNNRRNCLEEDPFKYDEEDPSLANAYESFLWEIETLKNHASLSVRNIVKSLLEDSPNAWNWRNSYLKPPSTYSSVDYLAILSKEIVEDGDFKKPNEEVGLPMINKQIDSKLFTASTSFGLLF